VTEPACAGWPSCSRLLAGETDKLAAFTAAKKALRAKHPDPFHWAPFPYIGSPE
jgi:hypothetical protein